MIRSAINKTFKPISSTMVRRKFLSTGVTPPAKKTIEKESAIEPHSLIPKEFRAESDSFVTGKRVDFYQKIFERGTDFASNFIWIFILFPGLATLGVKTYKDVRTFGLENEIRLKEWKMSKDRRF
jgi:hypothetical protein